MPALHPLQRWERSHADGKNGQCHAGGKECLPHPLEKERVHFHNQLKLSYAERIATPTA
jgi:hypothetical protein